MCDIKCSKCESYYSEDINDELEQSNEFYPECHHCQDYEGIISESSYANLCKTENNSLSSLFAQVKDIANKSAVSVLAFN